MAQRPLRKKPEAAKAAPAAQPFAPPALEREEARQAVDRVEEAARKLSLEGEEAFSDFRITGSRWRQDDAYLFILDLEGNLRVHPDPILEGSNQIDLQDVNGKRIIQGLIGVTLASNENREGWYHYLWPVPGSLLPRWKSSYVKRVETPSGKSYVVGAGIYDDSMEKAFAVDWVSDAVRAIELKGPEAFSLFRDPTGPFMAKDCYLFVINSEGYELVNPAFPSLEGRSLIQFTDTRGKQPIREMLDKARQNQQGWVDYYWPKPGESLSTKKTSFVARANWSGQWFVVGCGVYAPGSTKSVLRAVHMTPSELMQRVHEAATLLEREGELAYSKLQEKGSRWFHDDSYFFAWSLDGERVFHAAEPERVGESVLGLRDVLGRPYAKMILEVGASSEGQSWVHYMHPKPDELFPVWKSVFVKRVTYPSGRRMILGCGIYQMKMDHVLIEDLVNRAAKSVAENGQAAFSELRERTGPYSFMDTYVFVQTPQGVELVNSAFPNLEGRSLLEVKDLQGAAVIRDEIEAVERHGSAWIEAQWYRPGSNAPARKLSYVKKVQHGGQIFIVGSGLHPE